MKNKLIEGVDYYLNEEGLLVLTENFHLDRGFCCGNGCKHCPYDYEKVPEPRRTWMLTRRKQDAENNASE